MSLIRYCRLCGEMIPKEKRLDANECGQVCRSRVHGLKRRVATTNKITLSQVTEEMLLNAIEELRERKCIQCGGPLPLTQKVGKVFCSERCRNRCHYLKRT